MQIAKTWRRQPSALRLEGNRCVSCEKRHFPAALRCDACGSRHFAPHRFQGIGTVLTVSIVYEAPSDFTDQVPYAAALVQLDEGLILPVMLTDVDMQEVCTGIRVQMVTRRLFTQGLDGPIVYAYKFSPLREETQ